MDKRLKFALGLFIVHVGSLLVFKTGVSWASLIIALILYQIRSLGVMAGQHRYFAHRSFKTSRPMEFLIGIMAILSAHGPIIDWMAHHKVHHRDTETPNDLHSPRVYGFWTAHVGWFFKRSFLEVEIPASLKKLMTPELRFLDKIHDLVFVVQAFALYFVGSYLEKNFPHWNTNGLQLLTVAFFIAYTLSFHVTFAVNTICHMYGIRDFDVSDDSRNNFFIALIGNGEGWHNNHHRFPKSAQSGFYWWQIDGSYYFIRVLELCRLVWSVNRVDPALIEAASLKASKLSFTKSN